MQWTVRAPNLSYGLARLIVRRAVIAAIALLFVAVFLFAVTPQGRAAVNTFMFVTQVLPAMPIKLQEHLTAKPTREEVHYPLSAGNGLADLYVPGSGSNHSAVLLFLGVNPAGRNDPRVVGLAESLARTGTVVMIPWSDTMTQKRIAIEEMDNLVHAFLYLRGREEVDPGRMGMGGFCVGASLATVAAQDPRIRDDVRFVNFFGGYFSAEDLVKSVVTRSRFYGGEVESWSPDKLSVEVVRTHLIEGLQDPGERELLRYAFFENPQAVVDVERLSGEAQAVYRLLAGPTLEEADALIGRLPSETLDSLRRISPSARIEDLKAKALIMHDREDALVPSEESRRLAEALEADNEVYYTEFSLFQHVDPTQPLELTELAGESFKLFLHMYNVMREL
ncbi:MAG: hypothetical protein L0177_05020 [Chloroflexi bacterium]|nr:hypothetical protein [Chloroflexota bacterium]